MSNRLGGFIAGQNINASIGTFTIGASPDLTFASTAATPAVGQALQFTTTGTLPLPTYARAPSSCLSLCFGDLGLPRRPMYSYFGT